MKKETKEMIEKTGFKTGDEFIKAAQKVAKDLGMKTEIVIGHTKNDGSQHVKQVFSSKNPKVKLKNKNKLNLEVEISSTEQENNQLLHSLK